MIFDCTGTIIHNQWILSAAHCEPEHFVDGSLNATINGKDYAIEKVISHSEFNNETLVKDIMLVKLKEPIEFSENVSSICLFQNLTVPEMEVAAVAGFGIKFVRVKTLNDTYQEEQLDSTEVIYENNELLRETPVLIRNMSYCFDYEDYENEEESFAENVTETPTTENVTETSSTENVTESAIICAGGANRGTTQGDSGGPLLVIRDHHWVQYGVTSFGSILPVPGDLLAVSDQGIYTKVNAYCDWIAEKTSNEVTCQ
uniref:Peptidase S1 domain-containing protein n=1 Tax=Panagrolaimus davidi TaxID=227884 RepID=A0A914PMJ4_9BILA